jgi:hypothetical protein
VAERDDEGVPALVTRLPLRVARTKVIDRRPARVARILALAHHIDAGLRAGTWSHASDVSRVLGLSRNRVSQVLALLNLAPDLQEQVLFIEAIDGVEPITEKALFEQVAKTVNWAEQRAKYAALVERLVPTS